MSLCKKPAQAWAFSMGLDMPIAKCGSCERGELLESNVSILYVEIGA